MEEKERLINSLQIIDPLLQFLTKATGRTITPLSSLRSIIPKDKRCVIKDIPELYHRGVLHVVVENEGGSTPRQSSDDSSTQNNILLNPILFTEEEPTVQVVDDEENVNNTASIKRVMVGFPQPTNHFATTANGNHGQIQVIKGNDNYDDDSDDGKTKKKSPLKGGLHGSTKSAGKRRLAALKRTFKKNKGKKANKHEEGGKQNEAKAGDSGNDNHEELNSSSQTATTSTRGIVPKALDGMIHNEKYSSYSVKEQLDRMKDGRSGGTDEIGDEFHDMNEDGKDALLCLYSLLDRDLGGNQGMPSNNQKTSSQRKNDNNQSNLKKTSDNFALPRQAAYAGTQIERPLRNQYLPPDIAQRIHVVLRDAMNLQLTECQCDNKKSKRKLYLHQAKAIESVLRSKHTLVCTGTGSGKSLCFVLPILASVMKADIENYSEENFYDEGSNSTSALIMFPTKALAQDQLTKLDSLIKTHPLLEKHVRPGIIDGDTPHQNRGEIAKRCNIILSNPDTLHAAILPGWKGIYRNLLSNLQYVVIDELHSYEGAFGAHVSLVLSRLSRICSVASFTSTLSARKKITFVGCSATIGHPDTHFRLICPIASKDPVTVITAEDDGSKCAAKHFFVWNPPLLDSSGNCIGRITVPSKKGGKPAAATMVAKESYLRPQTRTKRRRPLRRNVDRSYNNRKNLGSIDMHQEDGGGSSMIKRSHAADETARILSHLVQMRVRCIAFCKTRSLAEWVFERCTAILRATNEDLASLVEVYRGGYSASIRRGIEGRLFRNELFGVVGTSALELGVDIGGIDVTLHCGYPGSINSVLQQAGRAGRGASTSGPSYSITVCFSSPSEQHLWKHPKGLLGRGLSAPPAVPLNAGIVTGHLLCASEEFPIVGSYSVTSVLNAGNSTLYNGKSDLSDHDLFGSEETYNEAFENLLDRKQIRLEKINDTTSIDAYSIHPSFSKPWSHVSLRSIEPINYSIVDLNHPQQVNTDVICEEAVLDHIPYSRVFYHAYPGAIIIHRGRRYKIHSMSSPPAFANCNVGYRYNSCNLGAFAKPTNAPYSTNALSITLITVVKQLLTVEIPSTDNTSDENSTPSKSERKEFEPDLSTGCIAGSGVVTVKRTVHGYKKLSLVNRVELSRSEISLPPMEYDTNAIWIDAEASVLAEYMPDYDKGVHALSHAIVAVAPLFVPCNSSDLDCDHSHFGCTRVLLFDVRAGGAGTCAQLWKYFFHPDGILKAAIDLLSECPLECDGGHYKGGCPGCIQAVPCINFQQDLSRPAGLIIARRMLARIQRTVLYQENCDIIERSKLEGGQDQLNEVIPNSSPTLPGTPRRKKRQRRLERAADLVSARKRNIVVGRQSWPTDHAAARFNTAVEDEPMSPQK